MRYVGKTAVDFSVGAAQEVFSQVAFGRDAPMTGKPTLGGALGSLAVKAVTPQVKGAMKPNFSGFSAYDKAAMSKNPMMVSNQGRQQLQGQGYLNSRDVGLEQRKFEMMKSSSPTQFKAHDEEIKKAMLNDKVKFNART